MSINGVTTSDITPVKYADSDTCDAGLPLSIEYKHFNISHDIYIFDRMMMMIYCIY